MIMKFAELLEKVSVKKIRKAFQYIKEEIDETFKNIDHLKFDYLEVTTAMVEIDDWSDQPSLMEAMKAIEKEINREEKNTLITLSHIEIVLDLLDALPYSIDISKDDIDSKDADVAAGIIRALADFYLEEEELPSIYDIISSSKEIKMFSYWTRKELNSARLKILYYTWKARYDLDYLLKKK